MGSNQLERVHHADRVYVQLNPATAERGYCQRINFWAPLNLHLAYVHHQKVFIRWLVVV